jgi:hypothetical protein
VGRWYPNEVLIDILVLARIDREIIIIGRVQRREVSSIVDFSLALREEK